jgi:hypothetical protein
MSAMAARLDPHDEVGQIAGVGSPKLAFVVVVVIQSVGVYHAAILLVDRE